MKIHKIFAVVSVAALLLSSVPASYAQQKKSKKITNYNDMIAAYNGGKRKMALDIALSYKNGINGAVKDPEQALGWLDKAFDAGVARAATIAGTMYYKGAGVKRDFQMAEQYYRKASAKGNEDAMIRLGYMYEHGYGVSESIESARNWYGKAAKKYEKGKKCSVACKYYADASYFYTANNPDKKEGFDEALKWYEKAFDAGYMEVSVNLASLTYQLNSTGNANASSEKAIKFLFDAAGKGYVPAMEALAEGFMTGKYGKRDMINAYAWSSLLVARGLNKSNVKEIRQTSERNMNDEQKKKAQKSADALIKKLVEAVYLESSGNLD